MEGYNVDQKIQDFLNYIKYQVILFYFDISIKVRIRNSRVMENNNCFYLFYQIDRYLEKLLLVCINNYFFVVYGVCDRLFDDDYGQ